MANSLWGSFFVSIITVLVTTPIVIRFAKWFGAVDSPNNRKVHKNIMPRLGGLAIFVGVVGGFFYSGLYNESLTAISLGAILIVILGVIDDKYSLSARAKLIVQLLAAGIVVSSGLRIEILQLPGLGLVDLGFASYPLTLLWIVAITNAINLIDGLDGLAAGTSIIVISTIAVMAAYSGKYLILSLSVILIGSTLGFLFYNFHPAKIFMGDTGSLFLGYCIGVLSLLGLYKTVTLFSFVVPIIILGVPIFDTVFAIVRRVINKKSIGSPDKNHLHHRLLFLGFSHKNTVLIIYGLSFMFSIIGILLSRTTMFQTVVIVFALMILLEILAEIIGLVNLKYKPLIKMYKKMTGKGHL
ncbi:MraY family glycosyltransferase [Bacillus sp. REN3]|uniref:glycosyltransferase family 4 protein n=1 Tax=Bacillus sp. REN3 TaxID=2802440 RepID=UPI001AEE0D33|nr:MraY family glycosyltransferase [Bacillus sp. REN3]